MSPETTFHAEDVVVRNGPVLRRGRIAVPRGARALVLFVHGGGSGGRSSPRDAYVAAILRRFHLATVQIDLLSQWESASWEPRLEVSVLADRLAGAVAQLAAHDTTSGLPIAVVGGGTGSPAVLRAAAGGLEVTSIVCRGGPLHLAREAAPLVASPTLLLVRDCNVGRAGGVQTEDVRALAGAMRCERRVEVVRRATPQFETPEVLDEVAERARRWIVDHATGR